MTTIAYDTKTLVSDSRSSLGDMIYEEDSQKIFPNVDRNACAMNVIPICATLHVQMQRLHFLFKNTLNGLIHDIFFHNSIMKNFM